MTDEIPVVENHVRRWNGRLYKNMERRNVMKRHITEVFMILFALFFLVCSIAVADTSGDYGDIHWNLNDDGTLIISGNGPMKECIPSSFDDFERSRTPWGDSIKTLIIEKGVTTIGSFNFNVCHNLTNITIPEGVTQIGAFAFYKDENLLNFQIPKSVTLIGQRAFSGCENITEITIKNPDMELQDFCFSGCSKLTSITIPEGMKQIPEYAFACSGITSFIFPDSVVSIGQEAFMECNNLKNITIPNTVERIGLSAFGFCEGLSSFVFPGHILKLEDGLLHDCKNLTDVTIEEGVTEIGARAFSGCKSLTSVIIPSTVTKIGDEAFKGCSSLAEIVIPDSVESIGKYAFANCPNLKTIRISNNLGAISEGMFSECVKLIEITIPNGVLSIDNNAFYNCQGLVHVNIPNSITTIGDSAFCQCFNLEHLTLPTNLNKIGNKAFYLCYGLKGTVNIPRGVSSIGDEAFTCCLHINHLSIPDTVTSIGNSAFSSCVELMSVTIPASLSAISSRLFWDCSNLTSVTFLGDVSNIGEEAFEDCYRLEAVIFFGRKTSFSENTFSTRPKIYCYEYSDADSCSIDYNLSTVYLESIDLNLVRKVIPLKRDLQINIGDSVYLLTAVIPDYDEPNIVWESSNSNIATVVDGVITGVNIGSCTISASVGNAVTRIEVSVHTSAIDFEFSEPESWTVAKEPFQMKFKTKPEGGDINLTWSTSARLIATIDNEGKLTTKQPGDVVITAISDNGIQRDALVHVCYPVSGISFEDNTINIPCNFSAQLIANVEMNTQSCVNHLINFTSSDENIAVIDSESGIVSAISKGTATITATASNGISATCEVIVREANVLILPESTKIIEKEAFANLSNADEIIIPAGVTQIDPHAFDGCQAEFIVTEGTYGETWAIENSKSYRLAQ